MCCQVEVREEDVGWIYGIYTCRAINKMGSTNWEIDMREERGDPGNNSYIYT